LDVGAEKVLNLADFL